MSNFFPTSNRLQWLISFLSGNGDLCRCYQCGGVLCNWKANENPFEEHASFFPHCKFIRHIKNDLYFEYVDFKKKLIGLRSKIDNSYAEKDIDCMRQISFQNYIEMKKSSEKLYQRLKLSSKNKVENDSFDILKQYLGEYFFFFDCQKLFKFLRSLNIINDSVSEDQLFSLDPEQTAAVGVMENPASRPDKLNCIICCDKQIQIVFVPCGHQLACLECSRQITDCPMCRKKIEQKIRTFFPN